MTDHAMRPRRARWRRRLWIAAGILVAGRLLLALALPGVLRRVLASRGLDARWDRLELSLLGGEIEVWGLRVGPKRSGSAPPGGEALALRLLRGDLSVPALLTGKIHLRQAEAQSLRVALVREADGRWRTEPPFEFPAEPDSSPREATRSEADEDEEPPGWPLRADLVNAGDLEVVVRDEAAVPPIERRFEISATVRDFGARDRPARISLRARSAGRGLDGLAADVELEGKGPRDLRAKVEVALTGLDLARLPIEPASLPFPGPPARVDASLDLRLERAPIGGGERVRVAVEAVSLAFDGDEVFAGKGWSAALERDARGWRPASVDLRGLLASLDRALGERAPARALRVERFTVEPAGTRRRFDLALAAPGALSSLDVAGDFDWNRSVDGALVADLSLSPLVAVLEGGRSVRLERFAVAVRLGAGAPFTIERVAWSGLEVRDEAGGEPVVADASGEIGPIAPGGVGVETQVAVDLALANGTRAAVRGRASVASRAQAADLAVTLEGLPPLDPSESARARASFDLALARRAEGGRPSTSARIERLRWSEGGREPLGLDRFEVIADPLDPANGRIVVTRFVLEGLRVLLPGAEGAPILAEVSNEGPLVVLDAASEESPAWALRADLRAPPIVDGVAVRLRAEPHDAEVRVEGEIGASGLNGTALARAIPALAAKLDASALDGGSVRARFSVAARPSRRGPWAFDAAAGFPATVEIDGVALRDGAGRTLAGLDRAEVTVSRFVPGGRIEVARAEAETPRLVVERRATGLAVAGVLLVVPSGAAAAAPADAPPAGGEAEPAIGTAPTVHEGPPWSIGEVELRGLDVVYSDQTCDPALVAPLVDLDATIRDLGVAGRPAGFQALVRGGEVELPRRARADSLLEGVAGAAAALVAGEGERPELERRPIFDELLVSGRLDSGRPPAGQVQISLRGFELPAVAGAAEAAGVKIGDGVLDLQVRALARGAEGSRIQGEISLTDLSASEPGDGPIRRCLRLPAPLETVIFLLRDDEGRIRISPSFDVAAGGVRTTEILATAASAIGELVARAVAAAPMRVVGTVTDLAGVGAVGKTLGLEGLLSGDAPDALVFAFDPGTIGGGVAAVEAAGVRTMAPAEAVRSLVERLSPGWLDRLPILGDRRTGSLVLEHRFGRGDLARAELLGSPDARDALDLAARLREERAELLRRRDDLTADARALHALGAAEEAAALGARLRGVDRRIEELRAALDRALDLLGGSAERRRASRTRATAIALARARLALVRDALRRAAGDAVEGLDARLVVRNPRVEDSGEGGGGEVRVRYRPPE